MTQILGHFPIYDSCAAPNCAGTVVAVGIFDDYPEQRGAIAALCVHHAAKAATKGRVYKYMAGCEVQETGDSPPCGGRSEYVAIFHDDGSDDATIVTDDNPIPSLEGFEIGYICARHAGVLEESS